MRCDETAVWQGTAGELVRKAACCRLLQEPALVLRPHSIACGEPKGWLIVIRASPSISLQNDAPAAVTPADFCSLGGWDGDRSRWTVVQRSTNPPFDRQRESQRLALFCRPTLQAKCLGLGAGIG